MLSHALRKIVTSEYCYKAGEKRPIAVVNLSKVSDLIDLMESHKKLIKYQKTFIESYKYLFDSYKTTIERRLFEYCIQTFCSYLQCPVEFEKYCRDKM